MDPIKGVDARKTINDELNLDFSDLDLVVAALTHPSLGNSIQNSDLKVGIGYQRLEFLGDRVLGLVIATYLFQNFTAESEGDLALRLANLVSADSLVAVANRLRLVEHIKLSRGFDTDKQKIAPSILADSCEALIGAIYIDGGLSKAKDFILREWANLMDQQIEPPRDPVTTLQIWTQARGLGLPVYDVVDQSGPAHSPVFDVVASIAGITSAHGKGKSKKIAIRKAAEEMLGFLRATDEDSS